MRVDKLYLSGFRNFYEAGTDFSPDVNVIFGDNAQGKTNLLEAIWFLAAGKSFRERSDAAVIGFESPGFIIKAEIFSGDRDQTVEISLPKGGRKTITVNGGKIKTAAGLNERLSAVLFCPEDLSLIRGGASRRRRLMDACISQLRPRYAEALSRFNRAYECKTRILRDRLEKPSLMDALDDYSGELARAGAELIYYRAHFVKKLAVFAQNVHREFSGGKEELELNYSTVKTVTDPTASPADILPELLEHQEAHREAEIASGLCLSGAHKDDIAVFINGREAKSFASQGQARTASLSLKLAEREMAGADANVKTENSFDYDGVRM